MGFSDGIIEIGSAPRHQFVLECDHIGNYIQTLPNAATGASAPMPQTPTRFPPKHLSGNR